MIHWVAHRAPNEALKSGTTAGGLLGALQPLVHDRPGTWWSLSQGESDELEGSPDRLQIRRVTVDPQVQRDFYTGFANGALWPVCHRAFEMPRWRQRDWDSYVAVNQAMASKIAQARGSGLYLIQDYHFALLPRQLRELGLREPISLFWHIPWPEPAVFEVLPMGSELLLGMLGSDYLGFQTQASVDRFVQAVSRTFPAQVSLRETRSRSGKPVFQVGIPSAGVQAMVGSCPIGLSQKFFEMGEFSPASESLDGRIQLLSVDRADYTKGILQRAEAFDRFLSENPAWRAQVRWVQIAASCRTEVGAYLRHQEEIENAFARLRERWGPDTVELRGGVGARDELVRLYRQARIAWVTPLDDGMNLVAQEFVAAQGEQGTGALILSRFAGSAERLGDAFLVNPFDLSAMVRVLLQALQASPEERRRRQRTLFQRIRERTSEDWLHQLCEETLRGVGAQAA